MKMKNIKKVANHIKNLGGLIMGLAVRIITKFVTSYKAKPHIYGRLALVFMAVSLGFAIQANTYRGVVLNPLAEVWSVERENLEIIKIEKQRLEQRYKDVEKFMDDLDAGERGALITYIKVKFGEVANTALAVAGCESGIRAKAIGDSHLTFSVDGREYGKSYGVFQIRHLQGRPEPEYLLNAKNNIDYAYDKYKRDGGFGAWTCYSAGYYQKHLTNL